MQWKSRRPPQKAREMTSRGPVERGEKLGPWNDDASDVGSYESDDGFAVPTDEEDRSDESDEEPDFSGDEQSGSEAGSVVSERNSEELDDGRDRETSATSSNSTNPSNNSESASPSSLADGESSDVHNQEPINPSKRRLISRKERDAFQDSPSKEPLGQADMNTEFCVDFVLDSDSSPISSKKKFRTPRGMKHRRNQQNESQHHEKENCPAPYSDDDNIPLLSESQKVKSTCNNIGRLTQPDSDDEVLRPSTLRKRRISNVVIEKATENEEDTVILESPSKRRRIRC